MIYYGLIMEATWTQRRAILSSDEIALFSQMESRIMRTCRMQWVIISSGWVMEEPDRKSPCWPWQPHRVPKPPRVWQPADTFDELYSSVRDSLSVRRKETFITESAIIVLIFSKQSLMHMNIISFHRSATHNRNVVKGPSPRLCKCPHTIIKRDGLWLIGEGKSNQIVLALSPSFKNFNLRQIAFMVDIRN